MSVKTVIECDGCGHRVETSQAAMKIPDGWLLHYEIGSPSAAPQVVRQFEHLCAGCISGIESAIERVLRERRESQRTVAEAYPPKTKNGGAR